MSSHGHGIWTPEEHERFLEARRAHPNATWRQLSTIVGTRSARQVQSHAQKYQEKVERYKRGLRKERKRVIRCEHRIEGDHDTTSSSSGDDQPSHKKAVTQMPSLKFVLRLPSARPVVTPMEIDLEPMSSDLGYDSSVALDFMDQSDDDRALLVENATMQSTVDDLLAFDTESMAAEADVSDCLAFLSEDSAFESFLSSLEPASEAISSPPISVRGVDPGPISRLPSLEPFGGVFDAPPSDLGRAILQRDDSFEKFVATLSPFRDALESGALGSFFARAESLRSIHQSRRGLPVFGVLNPQRSLEKILTRSSSFQTGIDFTKRFLKPPSLSSFTRFASFSNRSVRSIVTPSAARIGLEGTLIRGRV